MTRLKMAISDAITEAVTAKPNIYASEFKKRSRGGDWMGKEPYTKPELTKDENLKDITFDDCTWQCSSPVPGSP